MQNTNTEQPITQPPALTQPEAIITEAPTPEISPIPNAPGQEADTTEEIKTFTQAELDALIEKRLERERRKLQKTKPETEATATVEDLKAQLDKEHRELLTYKRKEVIQKAGIDEAYLDFAIYSVSSKLTDADDDDDFNDALEAWAKQNPQYKAKATATAPQATGLPHGSPQKAEDGVTQAFYAKYPHLRTT